MSKTDEDIQREIEQEKEGIKYWKKDKRDLSRMHKSGKSLDEIYDWEDNWDWLQDKVSYGLPIGDDGERQFMDPKMLREFLNNDPDWNDDRIWETLIEICDEKMKEHAEAIADLEKEKAKNKLKLQVIKKLGTIPSRHELDRLLRYEGSIERQLYKAMNQLERIQRLRLGDNVPAPVQVDLDVNTSQST